MVTTMRAGRRAARHLTGTARPGPPPDRPPTPAPPPPPRWRSWLLIAGILITVTLFLLPPPATNVQQLSYSQLKSDIAAGQVASVALGADGSVSGKLANGSRLQSSYPTSLDDPQFAQPAGQALGVTEQLPIDERHLSTEGYLKDSLAIRMGGGWLSSWCSVRPRWAPRMIWRGRRIWRRCCARPRTGPGPCSATIVRPWTASPSCS
jgi:hypothetical protein